jgi:hypothetical protein
MVQINFALKQINAKVVYYGPGMSGKTTNLEIVHQRAPANNRGDLTSISTDGDRTLFFDYMPLDLGTIAGMKTCFQMYTVPGQVYYNSTRKLVLQGVDGVIFVADSGPDAMEANLEALRNLEENLNEYGKSLATLPHVIQFNKRDLPEVVSLEEMQAKLNPHGAPTFEAVAFNGQGVFPTLKGLATLVLRNIQAECAGGAPSLSRTGFHSAAKVEAALPTIKESAVPQPPAPIPAPPAVSAAPQPVAAAAAPASARPAAAGGAAKRPEPAGPAAAMPAAPAPSAPAARGGVTLPDLDVVSPRQKGDPLGGRGPAPAPRPEPGASRPPASPTPRAGGTPPAAASRPPAPGAQAAKPAAPKPASSQAPQNSAGARPQSTRPAMPPQSAGLSPKRPAVPAPQPAPAAGGTTKTLLMIAAAAVIGGLVVFVLLKFI